MLTSRNLSKPVTWIFDLVIMSLLFSIFYALWINSYALFTPDEGRYSEVAREMIVTNDYVTPRVNGVAFLDKPALYYWLQAAAIHMFGLKEWALRFFPALSGILGCLVTYIAGRLLFTRRTGIISAIILATSPLYFGAGHYANLDLEVAVFVSCSLLFFITAMHAATRRQQNYFLFSAYFFAALAALTKGLIGIVFPALIIGAWILVLNRWNVIKKMRLISGLILFSIITLPWYFLVQKANPEFFEFFFVKQQVSRFLTTDHFNNRTVAWFYVPIVIAGLAPWCIFLFQALGTQLKQVWKARKEHSVETYLLLWTFLIFIFFSIPKSKTIGYILPIFPALAMLLGNYLNQIWDKARSTGFAITLGAYLALCVLMITICSTIQNFKISDLTPDMYPYLNLTAFVFLVSGITVAVLFRKLRVSSFFVILTTTSVIFLTIITASAQALNQKTIKPLALEIKSSLGPRDEVITYYKYYQDLPLYLERRITILEDWDSKEIELHDNWVREMWYSMRFQDTSKWLIKEATFWQRWLGKKRLIVFTDKKLFADLTWKSRDIFKKEVYKIAEYKDVVIVSNQPNGKPTVSLK